MGAGETWGMFTWLATRRREKQLRRLQQRHLQLLTEARDLQRNGDIRGFAERTADAAAAELQLERFQQEARSCDDGRMKPQS